jgi:hypothetical protein
MAVGTQFGFGLAGFTPTIAAALAATGDTNWPKVAAFAVIACLISAVAVLTGPKKTHLVPTEDLGRPADARRRTVGTTGSVATS